MSRNMLQLPMLLFSSMMALKLVSDVSSNCCNILSNNLTEFSSIDCSPLCRHIILISFLADLCLGHICSHKGFFGNTKDVRQRRSGHVFAHRRNGFFDNENALQGENVDSTLTCAQMCRRAAACKGANFLANKGLLAFWRRKTSKKVREICKMRWFLLCKKGVS